MKRPNKRPENTTRTVLQEGVEEGTVLVLIGNKTDVCEDESQRVIKTKVGAKMADVSRNAQFVTSSLRWHCVFEWTDPECRAWARTTSFQRNSAGESD